MARTSTGSWSTRAVIGVAVLSCLVLLAALIPSPYLIERPGMAVDTLGTVELDGEEVDVIGISGADTYETTGELKLLTVSLVGSPQHPTSWLSLLPAVFGKGQQIVPMSDYFPEGVTEDDRKAESTAMMDASQDTAAAAAFCAVGDPADITLTVVDVPDDGPSAGLLEKGDVLVAVNGERLADFADLRRVIAESGAGTPVQVDVSRDGNEQQLEVVPQQTNGSSDPVIGAVISVTYDLPAKVDISLSEIGGPSAGMVFALAIYDRLIPGKLLEGLTVSGTGTIAEDGTVGPIGGIEQKLWAAAAAESDLLLMPLSNCPMLPDSLPGGLRIAPVATLDEAITAIESVTAGNEPAGIERCSAQ